MRIAIVIVPLMWLVNAAPAAAQLTTEDLGSLGVDSLTGGVAIYYSSPMQPAEAAELQHLIESCVARYRAEIPHIPSLSVAVLDSASWSRVSRAPYGIPHHNPASTPVTVVVPATAAALVSAGVPAEQAERFFRLLALHELGHVLTFAAVGLDRLRVSPATPWPVPGWYREFAADYFRISCLPTADVAAGASATWLQANRPAYTLLEDMDRLHEKRTAAGSPYFATPEYWTNGAWIMGVIAEAARLQYARLGDGFLALLREQWQRPGGSTSQVILEELTQSNPEIAAWLKSVGAIH